MFGFLGDVVRNTVGFVVETPVAMVRDIVSPMSRKDGNTQTNASIERQIRRIEKQLEDK
jgi:hypothetical protein